MEHGTVIWKDDNTPVHVPLGIRGLTWCGRLMRPCHSAHHTDPRLAGRTLCMNCGRSVLAHVPAADPRHSLSWARQITEAQQERSRAE